MYKRLAPYVFKYKFRMLFSFIFAVAGGTLTLITPYYTGMAVDRIIGKGNVDFTSLIQIIVLLGVMFGTGALFQWLVTSISAEVSYKTVTSLRKDAFDKINRMPISYFDSTPHGDIMSRLTNDIDAVSDGLFQGMTQLFMGIITLAGSIILMFRLNVLITLTVLVITPAAFVVSGFIAKKISKYFTRQSETTGRLNAIAEETIANISLVKLFSLEEKRGKEFHEVNDRLYECGQKAQWYSSLINPTTRLINNIVYISVGILGAFLAIHGEIYLGSFKLSGVMTVGLITSFLAYASQFARPINDITGVSTQLQSAGASLKRIFAVIDMAGEETEKEKQLVVTHGCVEFDDVSFSYDKTCKLIEHLTLTVEPGSVAAIVGSTGAGKTTLVNLLMRFYEPDSGKIFIDGTDIATVSRDSLRTEFSMVLQETVLFDATVAQNISYGKSNATMEEIIAAAKGAHIHKAIMNLSNGYDTIISESDSQLSTGQKQLLTIARAMLLKAKMLILDEATSNVDTLTEIYIQKAFTKMMRDKTSFVIAHRLSTVKNADVILVMDNGNVVEKGTHDELLKQKGLYCEIYESQFKNYT